MTILDRYIARQYLLNIALLLVLLFTFVVAIDVSLNMNRFVETAVKNARVQGAEIDGIRKVLAGALLVVDLWGPRLLQLYNYVIGLVLVGAMGFTFSQLVRHRELVAVMASGVSLRRLMRPVLVVACIALGLQAINQELILPQLSSLLVRDNEEAGKREITSFVVPLVPDDDNRVFFARGYEPASKTLRDLMVWERDPAGKPTRIIEATSARFDDKAKVWKLTNGTARSVISNTAQAVDAQAARAVPIDMIRTGLGPDSILATRYQSLAYNLSTKQIGALLDGAAVRDDVKDQLRRIVWGRAANFACVLLSLVVALPFFLMREPKNMVVQAIKCAPVAIGSILGSTLAILAPIPGLPVELAVFLPVIALVPPAIAMGTGIKT